MYFAYFIIALSQYLAMGFVVHHVYHFSKESHISKYEGYLMESGHIFIYCIIC